MRHGKVKVKHGLITTLSVRLRSHSSTRGRLTGPGFDVPCAIGRSGVTWRKKEGDGASPAGLHSVSGGFYRPDRFRVRPRTQALLHPAKPLLGWCDAPADANYNRPIRLPYPASHEVLWRGDSLYDVLLVLDWNERPRIRGRGSAIFIHLARPGFEPTAGCVALDRAGMRRLLERLASKSRIRIV